jgi:exportin-2 (importin alpha re-exporter)
MSTNLQELVGQLTGTMSPDAQARNAATQYLKAHEQAPDLAVSLLQVLAEGSVDLAVKQAAAIYFKNLIMREWVSDTDVERIDVTSKNTIKVHIVQLMLVAPKLVQAQLSQALAIISQADFPSHWEQLLPELVSKLAQGDPDINVGVLETAHSIFHRYRYEVKSQALWEEIKYVLGVFQGPVTQIFQQTVEQLRTPNQPLALQLQLFKALHLEVEIFFSLNSQDLPEFFEDNMKLWFGNFQHFLQYSNPALAPNKDDAAGPVEEVQAAICEAINLYTNKYEEEFKEWVPVFVQEAWNLLTRLDEQERYDTLATTAIRFLTSVVKKDWNKELFNNEAALKTICEKVVIPQLKLRESDVEMFTMNGLEFIRRDIEGSDIDTRRRTTVDFVQV